MKTKMQEKKIFIQIASYRDPQLVPTIKDCMKNAKYPDNLVFCIAWQRSKDDKFDDLSEFVVDKRFIILDIDYKDSKGACWARNKIQQLYDDEEYTLQLDSHHRFAKDWDVKLIRMLKKLQREGVKKPLLTSYAPSFNPETDPKGRENYPWMMNFDRFIPEGAIFFLPAVIPKELRFKPIPARFYSAHFCFTLGQFCREVQHNPKYYFHGEEISIAVRAFTYGYDLFHPNEIIIYHEYTRRGRVKQWDDDPGWVQKNKNAHLLNRQLFRMDGFKLGDYRGGYGFGYERTLEEYEEYAGIRFCDRSVQNHTLENKLPPNPGIKEYGSHKKWLESFGHIFKYCIDIEKAQVSEKDYDFWVVAFHDESDKTVFRQDAGKQEIQRILNDPDGYCKIWREFQAIIYPSYWVVWPHSESKGWCERVTGRLK